MCPSFKKVKTGHSKMIRIKRTDSNFEKAMKAELDELIGSFKLCLGVLEGETVVIGSRGINPFMYVDEDYKVCCSHPSG